MQQQEIVKIKEPQKYKHAEAFALMNYKCEDCGYTEQIWNSRDGVTPFGLKCPKCGSSEHLHWAWHLDRTIENYQPKSGQRIFIDLTDEKYKQYKRDFINQNWDIDSGWAMKNSFESKEKAFEILANDFQEGQPDIIIYDWVIPPATKENPNCNI